MEEPKMSFKGDQKPVAKKPVAKKVVAKKAVATKKVERVSVPIMAPQDEPTTPSYEMVFKNVAISEGVQAATAIKSNIYAPCAGTVTGFYAVIDTADTTAGVGTISIKVDGVAVTGATISIAANQAQAAKVSSPGFTAVGYESIETLELDLAVTTTFAGSPLVVDIHVVMGAPLYDDVAPFIAFLRTMNQYTGNAAMVNLGLYNEKYMNWAMYNVNL